ncbi:hypothetical protein ABZ766_15555 [Streptomyces sp. NPDC006670]|uniref:YncE family protein n=1 Tax=Streptomyces sp. NPDC006670 TaxID=3154476 RepID=UPI0033E103EC
MMTYASACAVSCTCARTSRAVFSPDGRYLYAANWDPHSFGQEHPGYLWKLDAATLEVTARVPATVNVGAVRLSADGNTLHVLQESGDSSTLHDTDLNPVPGTEDGVADYGFTYTRELGAGIVTPDGALVPGVDYSGVHWRPAQGGSTGAGSASHLPGDVIALTAAAAPTLQATRLEVGPARALAPITVPGLSARLTAANGAPVAGAVLRFTSPGGIHLGTATTDTTGHATLDAELRLPLNPDTGAIDPSRLTGPYQVTYTGQASYPPATGHADITLA